MSLKLSNQHLNTSNTQNISNYLNEILTPKEIYYRNIILDLLNTITIIKNKNEILSSKCLQDLNVFIDKYTINNNITSSATNYVHYIQLDSLINRLLYNCLSYIYNCYCISNKITTQKTTLENEEQITKNRENLFKKINDFRKKKIYNAKPIKKNPEEINDSFAIIRYYSLRDVFKIYPLILTCIKYEKFEILLILTDVIKNDELEVTDVDELEVLKNTYDYTITTDCIIPNTNKTRNIPNTNKTRNIPNTNKTGNIPTTNKTGNIPTTNKTRYNSTKIQKLANTIGKFTKKKQLLESIEPPNYKRIDN